LRKIAFLVSSALLAAASWAQSGSRAAEPMARSGAQMKGGESFSQGSAGTYGRTCGYCHGQNVGPVILGRNLSPDIIVATVRNGMGAMPAFRPTEINDTELAALAEWISKSPKSPTEHGK
jgi:mono/diheme cytochrome c family protein